VFAQSAPKFEVAIIKLADPKVGAESNYMGQPQPDFHPQHDSDLADYTAYGEGMNTSATVTGAPDWATQTYGFMWTRSFSFSAQKDSKISLSGSSNCVTLIVNGLVYIWGSSIVICKSIWPKSRRRKRS
jgi:hypothetical protein